MTDMAKVQEALKFTSADLPYNRRGERSPAQIKAWDDSQKGCARNSLWIFLVLLALTAAGTAASDGEGRAAILVTGGIFTLVAGGLYLLMRSPTEGIEKIYSISGPARLSVDRGNEGAKTYLMMVDKIDFALAPELYDLLEHETVYTAHYQKLGRTNRLVSLEEGR